EHGDAQRVVGLAQLGAPAEAHEVHVVAVAGVEELVEGRVVGGHHGGQPLRVAVEHGDVVVGDVAHRDVGDAQLDHAAGAEQLVGELDGEGDGQVLAVGGAAHHVLARQAHQRVGDVRRLQVHRRGQRPG